MKRAERDDSLIEEPQDTKQLKRHDNNNNFLSFSILPVDLIEEILTFHYIQFYPITFKYYLKQKKLLKSEMFLFTCFGKKEERIINLWKNVKIYDPLLFYNEFMKNQSVNPFLHCHSISIKGEADQKYKLHPFFTKLFEDYSKRVNSSLAPQQKPVLWSQSEDILIEPSITTPWIPSMVPLPDLSLNNVLNTSNNSNLQLTNDLNNNLNSNLHNLSNYSISLNSGLNNLTNNNSYTLNSLLNNMSQVNPPNSIQTSNSIRPLQPLPNSSLFPNSLNRSQFSQQLTQPNQFLPSQLLQNRPPLLNYNNTLQMNNNTISSSLLGNSMSSIVQPTLSLMSIPPTPPSNLQTALLNQLMNNNSNLSLGNNIIPITPSMNYPPTTTQHSISSTILNTISSPQPINNNMMSTLSLNKLPPLRSSSPIKQEVIPPKVIYYRLEKLKINPVLDNYYFNISNDSFPNLKTLHCHIHSFNGLCSALKNNKISIKPKSLDSLIVDCNYIEVDFNSIYKNIKVIRFTNLKNQMLKPLESLLPYIEKAHLFIDDDHGEFLDLINRFNSKVVEIGLSKYYGALINPSTLSSTPIELSNYENLLPKITSYSGNFDKALLNCKNLTSLDFGFNHTTFDNFTDFSIFPKLETLKLRLQHDKDYTSILSLKNLTKLSLKGITNFNSKSLQWLQLLENLKKLEIDNNSALDYLPPYLTTLTVESENSETDITNIIENYPTIVKLRVKVNLEVDSSGDAVNLLSTRRLICTNTDHLLDLNVTGTCHYDSSYE
ncbi:hypothetical protein ABK040_013755 [Willaertia magna]